MENTTPTNSNSNNSDEYVECPFCHERDFSLEGLKSHLTHGDCEIFNNTPNLTRLSDLV